MSYYKTTNIKIEGIATAVPKNKIYFTEFYDKFGQEHMDKFVKTTGIKQIYRTDRDQTASDLGFIAAKNLLTNLGVDKDKIGLLLFATQIEDYGRPSDSYILHYRLGLSKDCACIDTGLGCPGFIYSLQAASSMLADMEAEYALLIVSDTCSKQVYPEDKSVAAMLSDAGAAILLKRDENWGEARTTLLKADGSGYRAVIVPGGYGRYPDAPRDAYQCSDGIERTLHSFHMDGMSVFSFGVQEAPEAVKNYLMHTGTSCDDYDSVCLHQANLYMMKQIAARIKCDRKKLLVSIDRYGNTSGVSIPLTLCDFYGEKQGEFKVLACAFGLGLGWGVTTLHINAECIYPIVETDDYFKEGKIRQGEW